MYTYVTRPNELNVVSLAAGHTSDFSKAREVTQKDIDKPTNTKTQQNKTQREPSVYFLGSTTSS